MKQGMMKKTWLIMLACTLCGCGEASAASLAESGKTMPAEPEPTVEVKKDPAVWALAPSLSFDKVHMLNSQIYRADGAFYEYTGYPQEWCDIAAKEGDTLRTYALDAIAVKKDGLYGIYDYEGNELYPVSVEPRARNDEFPFEYFPDEDGFGFWKTTTRFDSLSDDFTSVVNEIAGAGEYRTEYGFAYRLINDEVWYVFDSMDSGSKKDLDCQGHACVITIADPQLHVNGWAVYDKDGNRLPDSPGVFTGDFVNGYYVVSDGNANSYGYYFKEENEGAHYGFVKAETGELIGEGISFEDYGPFEDGYAPVKKDGKWGFIDEEGNAVTDFVFDDAGPLYRGLAYVSANGIYGVLDLKQSVEKDCDLTETGLYPNGLPQKEEAAEESSGEAVIGRLTADSDAEVYDAPAEDASSIGSIEKGVSHEVYEIRQDGQTKYYRIEDNQWVKAENGMGVVFTQK